MITIPNKDLHQMYYDNLTILWEALCLELNDKRLVGFISPEEHQERVALLEGSTLPELLYELLQCFGEDDFYTLVKPALKELQEINPDTEGYLEAFTKCFSKLEDM